MPVLIDLDAVRPPAPRPAVAVPRWLPGLLAASLLLFLGGAAAPRPVETLRQVAVVEGVVTTSLMTGSQLFTARPLPRTVGEVAEIRSVPMLGDGLPWTARVEAPGGEVSLGRSGSVLVVRTEAALTVLDARSGALRWHETASLLAVVGDRAVRSEYDDEDGTTTLLDMESGRALWSRPGIADFADRDATGRYLFTIDYDGRARVRDAADGRILAARRLEVFPDGERPTVSIVGEAAYLFNGSALLAVRLADLAPLWEIEAPLPYAVQACGALVCVSHRRGTAGVDPAGRVRWEAARWISQIDDVVVGADGQAALIDPATGRVIRELGTGMPTGDLMLRAGDDRMWVIGLRSRKLIGSLPGVVPFGCTAAGRFLGCRTPGESFTLWEIPD